MHMLSSLLYNFKYQGQKAYQLLDMLKGHEALDKLGCTTHKNFQKGIEIAIDKLFENQSYTLTPELRTALLQNIMQCHKKDLIETLKYIHQVVVDVAPESMDDLKNLRHTFCKKLVEDLKAKGQP